MSARGGPSSGSDGGEETPLDVAERNFGITYIGGPTVVLTIDGVRFITDPTFDPAGGEYASGRALLNAIPHALTTRAGAVRLGRKATGLDPWQSWAVRTPRGTTLSVTATPARHGPPGIEPISGDVIGFVIRRTEGGADLIYATGDTVWYEGTREVARRFRPKVVLAFAGGARTRGPFYLTMHSNDVVEAAAAFPDALIVPVHHDGWRHFTESQEDLIRAFEALGRGGGSAAGGGGRGDSPDRMSPVRPAAQGRRNAFPR